jgi:hypothetical protein
MTVYVDYEGQAVVELSFGGHRKEGVNSGAKIQYSRFASPQTSAIVVREFDM